MEKLKALSFMYQAIVAVSGTAFCFALFLLLWVLCTGIISYIVVIFIINVVLFAVAYFAMKQALKIDEQIESKLGCIQ